MGWDSHLSDWVTQRQGSRKRSILSTNCTVRQGSPLPRDQAATTVGLAVTFGFSGAGFVGLLAVGGRVYDRAQFLRLTGSCGRAMDRGVTNNMSRFEDWRGLFV